MIGCGRCVNVTSTGGVILSPNYPADYGGDANGFSCVYAIEVETGSRIKINFTTFIVENSVDVVTVRLNEILFGANSFFWLNRHQSDSRRNAGGRLSFGRQSQRILIEPRRDVTEPSDDSPVHLLRHGIGNFSGRNDPELSRRLFRRIKLYII